MIRSLDDLKHYTFQARDGDVGRVQDFYFDDRSWTVRYIVLETGRWLPGRRILVAPEAIDATDWQTKRIQLGLTQETIEKSPRAELHEPVSQQHLEDLHAYYGWAPYWNTEPSPMGGIPIPRFGHPRADAAAHESDSKTEDAAHLRSVDEVLGYSIEAEDDSIGVISDFGCEEGSWTIRYLVVDTRKWLPGKRVAVSPDWVERVDWPEAAVHVDLPKRRIEESPAFDPSEPFNRETEEVLYDFYGRPKYWSESSPRERQDQSK